MHPCGNVQTVSWAGEECWTPISWIPWTWRGKTRAAPPAIYAARQLWELRWLQQLWRLSMLSCSHKMMVTESIESLVQAEKGRRAKAKVAPRLHFEADPNWSWWNIRWKIHEKTIKKVIWIQHFCWLNHGKPIYIHFWSLLCAVVWPHCSPFIRVSYGQHWDSPRSLVAAMKVGTNPKSWIQYSTLSPFW